jgi:hypothetical protein
MWRRVLIISGLVMLGLAKCSSTTEEAEIPAVPTCDQKLGEGTCIGITLNSICQSRFCVADNTCNRTYYVDSGSNENGDGTRDHPFSSLTGAIQISQSGDCLALAAGKYPSSTLPAGVSVLGKGASDVILESMDSATPALEIKGGQGAVLRGITLTGKGWGLALNSVERIFVEQVHVDTAGEVGIFIEKATDIRIKNIFIEKTRANDQKAYGIGLAIVNSARVDLALSQLSQNAAEGILASESALVLSSSVISENKSYGVAITCSQSTACKDGLSSTMDRAEVVKNVGIGVFLNGGRLVGKQNAIKGTILKDGMSRGLNVQGGGSLDFEESAISEGEGLGIAVLGSASTISKSTISKNNGFGIWLQDISSNQAAKLSETDVLESKGVGIAVAGSTRASIHCGKIANTRKAIRPVEGKTEEYADGIWVFGGSVATIDCIQVEQISRIGLLVDEAEATVSDAVIDGATAAIALQGAGAKEKSSITNVKNLEGKTVDPLVPTASFYLDREPIKVVGDVPFPIP